MSTCSRPQHIVCPWFWNHLYDKALNREHDRRSSKAARVEQKSAVRSLELNDQITMESALNQSAVLLANVFCN